MRSWSDTETDPKPLNKRLFYYRQKCWLIIEIRFKSPGGMHEKKTFFFCISLCSKHSKYSLWHKFKLLRAKWKGGSSRMKDKLYFCLLLLKSLFSVLFCNRTSGHRSSWHILKGVNVNFFSSFSVIYYRATTDIDVRDRQSLTLFFLNFI